MNKAISVNKVAKIPKINGFTNIFIFLTFCDIIPLSSI
nr:MAG TPA: hypothetical protein [Caudoviricetes sp.]